MRTSIDATAVFDITATALSTHKTTQPTKCETTGRAPVLSFTVAAGSSEQQAANSNAAARTLASEQNDDQPVPFWERHTSWPSLSLATSVQHAESSTMNICGRSRIHSIQNTRHAPPSIFSIDVDSSIAASLDVCLLYTSPSPRD